VSFQTGPGGQTNMGGIGSELDLFFRGLDGPRGGAGRMRLVREFSISFKEKMSHHGIKNISTQ